MPIRRFRINFLSYLSAHNAHSHQTGPLIQSLVVDKIKIPFIADVLCSNLSRT
jgi:hypothetical protein